jgi:Ca-activated chloride channel homolog
LAGLFLTVCALARPQTVFARLRRTSDAIAIQIVVDISGSMEALDLSERTPAGMRYRSRLDVVKETFARFCGEAARRPDRPGHVRRLCLHARPADHRSPGAPAHPQGRRDSVADPGWGRPGREPGGITHGHRRCLATACARLENAEPSSRIIVLLSDGESNTGIIQPAEAMALARKLGTRVYTIGVGSTGVAPFFGKDLFGRRTILNAHVTLDEQLLKEIAKVTGGQYFNVRAARGLDEALADIDKLEKTSIERDIYSQYHELFPWFLLPGLGLFALGAGMNLLIGRRIL